MTGEKEILRRYIYGEDSAGTKRIIRTNSSGDIEVIGVGVSSVIHGQASVTTAGTSVQLSNLPCRYLIVKAKGTNTGNIFVGDSDVSSANGFILAAGEEIMLSVDNAHRVWIDSSVNGEGVSFIGVN